MDDDRIDYEGERPCYQRQTEEIERREQEAREHSQKVKAWLANWRKQFEPHDAERDATRLG